jgi:hypothetical protein
LSLPGLVAALPLAGILAIAAAVNVPTLHDYFHGDDYLAFVDMVSKPALKHMWEVVNFNDADVYWRPLGELYYLAIWSVFGLNEVAFHAANITVFLITLVLLYTFCMQAGFGRYVALGACAFLTLFPNHAVSVSWITNGSRLVAVMFALSSLVMLQKALTTRKLRYEALAFLAFVLAALADETSLSLAPLALVYPIFFERAQPGFSKRTMTRLLPYAALALTLGPLQFIVTKDDPSFSAIGFGGQMPQHFWALTSKLVLPSFDSISFSEIRPEQWIAGAAAMAVLALALVWGSNRLRFLVLWVALGIAPFTIWLNPIAPARYVYMAAVPFAVIASWAAVSVFEWLRSSSPGLFVSRKAATSTVVVSALLILVAFLGSVGASMTRERDRAFANDTEPYRILADGLKASAPQVPKGSRIVIYYGIWNGLTIWPNAVAKTIYKDRSVVVVNVPRGQVETGGPGRDPKDVVLFYTGKGFIRAAPVTSASAPN